MTTKVPPSRRTFSEETLEKQHETLLHVHNKQPLGRQTEDMVVVVSFQRYDRNNSRSSQGDVGRNPCRQVYGSGVRYQDGPLSLLSSSKKTTRRISN